MTMGKIIIEFPPFPYSSRANRKDESIPSLLFRDIQFDFNEDFLLDGFLSPSFEVFGSTFRD